MITGRITSFSHIFKALFQASDLPVSSEQWAELNWEDFDFPKNWLAKNWSPPKTPIKKNLVSLR